MKEPSHKKTSHPSEAELAAFMSGTLAEGPRTAVTEHLGDCPECLEKVTAAHEAVSSCNDRGEKSPWWGRITKTSPYLLGAIVTFALSFAISRYFIQFLVATVILGIKWIVDAKSTKMLIMIYDAWKKGGEKEASRVLQALETGSKKRL